jgi:DNA-binding PadR family transcriptional regulator
MEARVKLLPDRVLATLARFDVATVEDIATSLGRNNPSQMRSVWVALQKLVKSGLASRDGDRGHVARYALTDGGRASLKRAS